MICEAHDWEGRSFNKLQPRRLLPIKCVKWGCCEARDLLLLTCIPIHPVLITMSTSVGQDSATSRTDQCQARNCHSVPFIYADGSPALWCKLHLERQARHTKHYKLLSGRFDAFQADHQLPVVETIRKSTDVTQLCAWYSEAKRGWVLAHE